MIKYDTIEDAAGTRIVITSYDQHCYITYTIYDKEKVNNDILSFLEMLLLKIAACRKSATELLETREVRENDRMG